MNSMLFSHDYESVEHPFFYVGTSIDKKRKYEKFISDSMPYIDVDYNFLSVSSINNANNNKFSFSLSLPEKHRNKIGFILLIIIYLQQKLESQLCLLYSSPFSTLIELRPISFYTFSTNWSIIDNDRTSFQETAREQSCQM